MKWTGRHARVVGDLYSDMSQFTKVTHYPCDLQVVSAV